MKWPCWNLIHLSMPIGNSTAISQRSWKASKQEGLFHTSTSNCLIFHDPWNQIPGRFKNPPKVVGFQTGSRDSNFTWQKGHGEMNPVAKWSINEDTLFWRWHDIVVQKTCHNNVIHVETKWWNKCFFTCNSKISTVQPPIFCDQNGWFLKFQLRPPGFRNPHLSWGGDHIHPIKASSRAFTPTYKAGLSQTLLGHHGDPEILRILGSPKNGRAESCVLAARKVFFQKKKRVEAEFDDMFKLSLMMF